MKRVIIALVLGCLSFAVAAPESGPATTSTAPASVPPRPPEGALVQRDIQYANPANSPLKMDIYSPKDAKNPLPCVMYIHGGGWRRGDKSNQMAVPLVKHGYIVASINHRPSTVATFPAQIEDCKAAVRFLRKNAAKYNLDPDKIGVWGDSSGGHLSALVATTGNVKEFDVGENLDVSSRVHAACLYYAPIDFLSIMNQGSNIKRGQYPTAPEAALLGGNTLDKKDLAIKASPITYITKDDPPFLLVHGSKDPQVPVAQSEQFKEALWKARVEATLELIDANTHGFATKEQQEEALEHVVKFFDKHLKK